MKIKLRKILTVYRKESLETLRDRRTLMIMIVVPLVLYPVLFTVMSQLVTLSSSPVPGQPSVVAIVPTIPASLDSLIRTHPDIIVVPADNPYQALKNQDIDAYVHRVYYGKKESLNVCFDATYDASRLAHQRLSSIVEEYEQKSVSLTKKAKRQLKMNHMAGIGSVNIAAPGQNQALIIGGVLPVLLIVTLMFGALYPAIDLTAGEKERGTLETVLTVPIHRLELLMGKFLTVATFALLTGVLNLISMALTYGLGLVQLGMLTGEAPVTMSPVAMLLIFLLIIPLALFISAIMLSISLFARSFKEAQNLATPFYLLLLFPAMLAMLPDLRLSNFNIFIPIMNVSLLFKEILLNSYAWHPVVLVFISNSIFAVLSILMISRLFNAEEILFSEGNGWTRSWQQRRLTPQPSLPPVFALMTLGVVMLLIFYAGSVVQLRWGHWGVLLTQWGLIGLPVAIMLRLMHVQAKPALSLRPFSLRQLFGTFLLTLGGLAAVSTIARIQTALIPESKALESAMEQLLQFDAVQLHPFIGYLIFAISPAICEELLFRGVLLSSFKARMRPALAVLLTGLLFGIFHIYFFRMLPTAVLGISLSYIVYRTGSVYPGMISHALHNSLALFFMSHPEMGKYTFWMPEEGSVSLMAYISMVLLLIAGLWLIQRRSFSHIVPLAGRSLRSGTKVVA